MIIKTHSGQVALSDSEAKDQFLVMAEQFVAYYYQRQHHCDDHRNGFYYQIMQVLEKKLLQMILEANQHSRSKAAKALGISRHTLRNKLEHYQLNTINPVNYGKLRR